MESKLLAGGESGRLLEAGEATGYGTRELFHRLSRDPLGFAHMVDYLEGAYVDYSSFIRRAT